MRGSGNNRLKDGKTDSSKDKIQKCNNSNSSGILKIVGIGPGGSSHLTKKAISVIKEAEVIVGYTSYIELIDRTLLEGKEIISTGMRKEIDRCRIAIKNAESGKYTVIVSSGDPGIYGMAGLVLELMIKEGIIDKVDIEIIPGVPALCAASSLLGAPLMHDFAVISLSDLMTPWELIKKRILASLEGDFVIVLYNPRSKRRRWQLSEALKLIMEKRGKDVPVGIVKNATRQGEAVLIKRIGEVEKIVDMIDMTTILIVGNSKTAIYRNLMITPRGYKV